MLILQQTNQWLKLLWSWELSTFDNLDSLRPSDMRWQPGHQWFRWGLAARLAPGHCRTQCLKFIIGLLGRFQWNIDRTYIFIEANAFENVFDRTAAVLSRPRCVKYSRSMPFVALWYVCRVSWMYVYTPIDESVIKFTMIMRTINVRYH